MGRPARGACETDWPGDWQHEATETVLAHLGTDERLRIVVGDPQRSTTRRAREAGRDLAQTSGRPG